MKNCILVLVINPKLFISVGVFLPLNVCFKDFCYHFRSSTFLGMTAPLPATQQKSFEANLCKSRLILKRSVSTSKSMLSLSSQKTLKIERAATILSFLASLKKLFNVFRCTLLSHLLCTKGGKRGRYLMTMAADCWTRKTIFALTDKPKGDDDKEPINRL